MDGLFDFRPPEHPGFTSGFLGLGHASALVHAAPQAHLAIGLIRIVDCNLTDEDPRAGNKIHQPQL